MKNIKVEFSSERIISTGTLTIVRNILGNNDFIKRCNRRDVTPNYSQNQIKNGDILLVYIGMLCTDKPAFYSFYEFHDNRKFYQYVIGGTPALADRRHWGLPA